jgi:recombinational DNA repair ATPase RecF
MAKRIQRKQSKGWMLPIWAKGLAQNAHTLTTLRDAVMQELEMFSEGTNPLSAQQVKALKNWLDKTA